MDIANKHVINKDSAMSWKDKGTILTQMLLRVLINNSRYLSRDRNKEHGESVSIENTKEYKQIWNDLQTLLQHKEEIVDMKEFIQKLQEKSKFI